MKKELEQLVNLGCGLKRLLNVSGFHVDAYEEDATIEFETKNKISKGVLRTIPNDYLIFPDDSGYIHLRIFEQSSEI